MNSILTWSAVTADRFRSSNVGAWYGIARNVGGKLPWRAEIRSASGDTYSYGAAYLTAEAARRSAVVMLNTKATS